MKKLLRPQDLLLLTLADFGDAFDEMRDPFMVMANAYKNMYGFIPRRYKRHNFKRNVMRSMKTGYIEKIEKNGEVYLRLTPIGSERVRRDFSLLTLSKKRWDGKWRVVFFDIEEISRIARNKLRAKLKELGFGMVQKSVWATPHDIGTDFYEFIEMVGLEEQVFLIEGESLLAGDPKVLARSVWKLDDLEEEYFALEREMGKLKQLSATLDDRTKKRKAKSTVTLRERVEKRKRELRNQYLLLLITDPHLPKELLPDNWVGDRVRQEIKLFT